MGPVGATAAAAAASVGSIWTDLGLGVLLQNEIGAVLTANTMAAALLGVSRDDLLAGSRPTGWRLCDDSGAPLPQWADLVEQIVRAGMSATIPLAVSMPGLPTRRLLAEVHPVPHRGDPLLLSLLRPVQTDIWRGAGLLDPLTALPNRPLLLDRLEQALQRAHTHGTLTTLVLADVRGLGEINEEWGFHHGDELLAVLAARLRDGLRDDHTVARYSGGTFAVVADHPKGTGEPIAAKVRHLAQRRVDLGRGLLHPGVRTGWMTSNGEHTVHQMICLADARLC